MDRQRHFVVQLSKRASKRLDCDEVGRMIEYLGGRRTDNGFLFHSVVRRDEAMDVLKQQFGSGYFAAAEISVADESERNETEK